MPDPIGYIGGSQYYKNGNETGLYWVSKQLTYARNVIQANADRLNSAILLGGRLFDRDLLLLQAYTISFLYVLNACVAGSGTERARFRRNIW